MLATHFLQQCFRLSDVAMEEALFDWATTLEFRQLLKQHEMAPKMSKTLEAVNAMLTAKGLMLKEGKAVDGTLIAARNSTKSGTGTRDPATHQAKKDNQLHFRMKAHVGVNADSGLVYTAVGTTANVSDVPQAHALVHGGALNVFADVGYQGGETREDMQGMQTGWHVRMRSGKCRELSKSKPAANVVDQIERAKARIRAKVEHPFRVVKRQFGYVKVRCRGLAKRSAQSHTPFALSSLWMACNAARSALRGGARWQKSRKSAQ